MRSCCRLLRLRSLVALLCEALALSVSGGAQPLPLFAMCQGVWRASKASLSGRYVSPTDDHSPGSGRALMEADDPEYAGLSFNRETSPPRLVAEQQCDARCLLLCAS